MKTFIFVKILLLITIMILACCKGKQKELSLSLFFNPSQAFYSEQVYFKALLNDTLLLDTVVKNKKIDNSELLKKVNVKLGKQYVLSINVNGKRKNIQFQYQRESCVNVFVGINDHDLLQMKELAIENKRRTLGEKVDNHKLLDSLRLNAKPNEYDRVKVVFNNCFSQK
ncbi:hypothetical protein [Pedobacter nutrimenti]|uniref:Lipoprotein n=1 Tax=Pedobacter nutrimenti TaxID=1241337 RepID=A0A318UJR4_9SPHI|nr:hypothetical protein [Pedobacter nutrimenti]PYF74195.1 hypothetical protein B0O44_104366 [Pedobacter nutrimenti]